MRKMPPASAPEQPFSNRKNSLKESGVWVLDIMNFHNARLSGLNVLVIICRRPHTHWDPQK